MWVIASGVSVMAALRGRSLRVVGAAVAGVVEGVADGDVERVDWMGVGDCIFDIGVANVDVDGMVCFVCCCCCCC